jgi:succinoglycan biosynthesis transport protein ExoP
MSGPDLPHPGLPGPPHSGNTTLTLRHPYQLHTALERQKEEDENSDSLHLTELLRIVLKHKWTLLAVVLLAASVAAVRTLLATPVYRSTVTLQIERVAPRVVSFNNDTDQEQGWTDENMSLKTQYELLRSRSLAERVIDELRLGQSPGATLLSDNAAPLASEEQPAIKKPPTGMLDRLVSGYDKLTSPATDDTKVLSRESVVGSFLGSLSVEPIRNSRLIKLHADSTDAHLAARMANSTVQAFISMGLERRMEAASYAKTFLEDQIKQTKAKLEESERKLNQYAQGKQILTLDDKTSVINQTYLDYANALSKAEQERMKAEAAFSEFKRNPDNVQQVMDSKPIQAFKEHKAKLEIEYQQNLRTYKPDFPKMVQLKAQITEVEAQIKSEVNAVAGAVKSQFDAAQRQEELIRDKLGQTRKQVLVTQDSSIDLNLLKREVDTNRQLYDGLLQRLKQVGVSGGVATNNISIVDAAQPALFPYKPNLRSNVLAGLGIGLILGLGLVFLLEYMDDSIRFPDEVERFLGVPLMGIIPFVRGARGVEHVASDAVQHDPRSTVAEAYRSVRTALQFSTSDGAPRQLVITSTTRDEGKTTTAVALAINFAQMGQRVLLIDADMRNPSVHKQLGLANDRGLSNLLSKDPSVQTLILPTEIANLSVLPAGPIPPNPADLLMGPNLLSLLAKSNEAGFDYVIVDAPPVLGIADSIVLGNQIQNVLFIVRAGGTRKNHIKNALRRLRQASLVPCGVVLVQSQKDVLPQNYESYYGYGAEAATVPGKLPKRAA